MHKSISFHDLACYLTSLRLGFHTCTWRSFPLVYQTQGLVVNGPVEILRQSEPLDFVKGLLSAGDVCPSAWHKLDITDTHSHVSSRALLSPSRPQVWIVLCFHTPFFRSRPKYFLRVGWQLLSPPQTLLADER